MRSRQEISESDRRTRSSSRLLSDSINNPVVEIKKLTDSTKHVLSNQTERKYRNNIMKSKSKEPAVKKKKSGRGKFRVAYTNRKAIRLLSESGNNELSMESISFLTDEEKLLLSSWGLPTPVLGKYRQKGVTSLFQWQLDCLENEKVLKGCNIVYSAPTSAGKTLVAEILMLKRVLELGKKAILILPFVSVAREKMYSLQELFGDIGIRVEGFMGSYNPPGGFQQVDIAVCTIEKANSLINRLLEDGGLHELGTIVVDELHLIGDPHRGYLLELLLTKIRFACTRKSAHRNTSMTMSLSSPSLNLHDSELEEIRKRKLNIQIIGMSATLPNLNSLAKWLEAELVISDFRPVPLVERIKIGDLLYDAALTKVGPVLQDSLLARSNDPDHIISLSLETVLNSHSVLIFCPSKQMCEVTAVQISREFFNIGNPESIMKCGKIGEKLRQQLNGTKIAEILAQLAQCPAGLDDALRKAVSFGVAFHHAGLTYDERDIIESGFKRGIIRVMIATSTLSAGVNLPARRVLIVTPTFDSLDVLTYRQMSGRAGRKGVDTEGESILISDTRTQKRAIDLIQAKLPPVSSALMNDNGSVTFSMKRALLEVIASGAVQSPNEVNEYTECTLLSHINEEGGNEDEIPKSQKTKNETIMKCLEFLQNNDFIRLKMFENEEKAPEYMTTQLGSACLASSLSPDEGIIVFKELEKARRCFVLQNELHVIYQVTPIYVADQWRNLDWNQFLTIWKNLSTDQKEVGRLIGVNENFIVKAMMGVVSRRNPAQLNSLNIHQRFYTALALNDLVNEMPIGQVAEKFVVNKGIVQNLQQAASTFAGMVTAFCNRLGWSNLELLLSQFQERLQFGVQRELVDLVRLDLLNGQTARILYNTGIKTIADLATSDPATVAQILHRAGPFSSNAHGGNVTKSVWMLGKDEGLSENEAARMIVQEARNFLQTELGLAGVQFRKEDDTSEKENDNIKEETEEDDEDTTDKQNLDEFDNESDIMDISESLGVLTKKAKILEHGSFRDDSADPIVTGFPKIPQTQTDSPLASSVTVLKHSTPLQIQNQQLLEEVVEQPPTALVLDKTTVIGFEDDDFDFEQEFLYGKFETSTTKERTCDVILEPLLMDIMTTSFMEVSLINSDEEIEPVRQNLNPLLSESILAAAAALVADDDSELDFSIEFQRTPEFETSLSQKNCLVPSPEVPIMSLSELVSKLSSQILAPRQEPISSEDEDDVQPSIPKTIISSSESYIHQQFNIYIFGKIFSVRRMKELNFLDDDFRSNHTGIGFGLTITPPQSITKSNRIGNKILGKRLSIGSSSRQSKPHVLTLCNGCTNTIWVFEWNEPKETGILGVVMKKLSLSSTSLAIMDAKEKLKLLLKHSDLKIDDIPNEKNIWDPKIAQWLLRYEEEGIHRDDMVRVWLDPEDTKELTRRNPTNSTSLSKEIIEALTNWKLMNILKEKLTSVGLWKHFLEIEMQSMRPLLLMELNGFKINNLELEKSKGILEFHASLLELRAYQIARRQFNLSSSKEIKQILRDLGLSDGILNRGGTGKDILRKINHEFTKIILEWRKVTSALWKTVIPFINNNIGQDGRIHGHYIHFTATGRVVMAEPSLQCIPRDFNLNQILSQSQVEELRHFCKIKFGTKVTTLLSKIENFNPKMIQSISLRNAFVSSDGHLLLSADYSQLELRILAHLAQERKLLQILNKPEGDVFKEISAQWKNISEIDVTDELRQEAKGIVYGVIYGMGTKTLSDQLGVDETQASEFIRGFMWTYPGIRSFIDETIKFCKERGFVETILGRQRYLEHINSNNSTQRAQAERQAVNTRIQGSAADLVKRAMIQIQQSLSTLNSSSFNQRGEVICSPVLHLHDELIYEVKESYLNDLATEIKKQMEFSLQLDVPTPVILKVGKSWGQLSSYQL